MIHFDFSKDIYYYEMLENFLNDKENIYKISNYILYNGNIYVCEYVHLCNARKITRAKFKNEITKKLKQDNLKINRFNINDKDVMSFFNINEFMKIANK